MPLITSHNKIIFAALLFALLSACKPEKKTETPPEKPFSVVKAFPHDITAFTEGLLIHDGKLFESTGQNESWIAEVDIASGTQNKKVVLDNKFFGEGITILNNKVYQLTWQNHVGFIYDYRTFKKIGEFQNDLEGWGMTNNSQNIIMSDGSEKLFFLDTLTQKIVRSVIVKEGNVPQKELNELEYVDGYVYANQWHQDGILKIDPANGNVVQRIDFSSLTRQARSMNSQAEVLNGIAYEKKTNLFLITGKNWPVLFAVRLKKDSVVAR